MWEKIKGTLGIVGACVTIICTTIVLILLRRSQIDRRRSERDSERDTAIQTGIDRAEDGAGRIEEGITKAQDRVERCEEHLHRAEELLRNAIRRSREEKSDTENVSDCNSNN